MVNKSSFLAVLTLFLVNQQVYTEFAVLRASTSSESHNYCVSYSPEWQQLPTKLSVTPSYKYDIVLGAKLCWQSEPKTQYHGRAVFSRHDDKTCSFSEKHAVAQHLNASELVIVMNTDDGLFIAVAVNSTDYINSTIPLAVMKKSDFDNMITLGKSAVVQLYVPPLAAMDWNLIVIWLLAVGTIVIGSYWSGMVASEQREKLAEKKSLSSNEKLPESNKEEPPSMSISPLMVIIFVLLICGFLLLVYYFYNEVIYVIIVIFAISSCTGMFECLNALVKQIPLCRCRLPSNPIPILKEEPYIKTVLVFCLSLAFTIWWVICRNASYGWVLQDVLGVLFCIFLLRSLRLPSMKICTLLLSLLLVYDVFFVFITPLFSASHHSVMVDVATGEGHKEQIPMVIKVPRIIRSALLLCQRDYSLLGFGDILVPGLFVSFCHSYDQMAKTPYRIYFVASSIAYSIGLIITFAALYFMKQGQPALVYLVPTTLGVVYVVSLLRGEFRNLWSGTIYQCGNTALTNETPLSDEEENIYDKNDLELTGDGQGERERLIN